MNAAKDIAVIIVSYKSAGLTIDCLRSIAVERPKSALRIRAVVVDNASGDAAAIRQAIEENQWSPWVTLVEAPKNGGFAYGNNLAIQHAYANAPPSYVHLLNPDTLVLEGAIDELVGFLEAHPQAGIAGSRQEDFQGNAWSFAFRFPSIVGEFESGLQFGVVTRLLKRWTTRIEAISVPQPVDWVCGASMMVRPAVLEKIGGFDENFFLYFEETDFCDRAQKAGFTTWFVPQSRIIHLTGRSTQVGTEEEKPKRMPPFWFESRRRFFAKKYGPLYAKVADIIAMTAYGLGALKLAFQGRRDRGIPHYVKDLFRHSSLWPKNRELAPTKSFRPSR
jgi:GT2 family glycosyltransferase